MYSRTSAKGARCRAGSLYAVQPLYGRCDKLAIAMIAVEQTDILHNDKTNVGISIGSNPGVEDARDLQCGGWIGSEVPSHPAMVTFTPYLAQATISPPGYLRMAIPRPFLPFSWHLASISRRVGSWSLRRKSNTEKDVRLVQGLVLYYRHIQKIPKKNDELCYLPHVMGDGSLCIDNQQTSSWHVRSYLCRR